jgi:hypothetical protein
MTRYTSPKSRGVARQTPSTVHEAPHPAQIQGCGASCTFADGTSLAAAGPLSRTAERNTCAGASRPCPYEIAVALHAFAARALEQHLPAPPAVIGAPVGLGAPDAGLHVVVRDVPHALAQERDRRL